MEQEILERIKEGLQDKKLSVVAELTGVNVTTLQQLRNGDAKGATLATADKLVKYLGIKVKL